MYENPVDIQTRLELVDTASLMLTPTVHDDVIKWKHFPRY